MNAILTGDIIDSRQANPVEWLSTLKDTLARFGSAPKDWEIYRGDSFQLQVHPTDAAQAAFAIKSSLKRHRALDVRIAIGIGEVSYKAAKITESNGSAFVYSGECFEQLKKQTLGIKTPWPEFDRTANLILQLCAAVSDNWTPGTAEVIQHALAHPEANQQQWATQLKRKSQSTISEALSRGGYDNLLQVLQWYKDETEKRC